MKISIKTKSGETINIAPAKSVISGKNGSITGLIALAISLEKNRKVEVPTDFTYKAGEQCIYNVEGAA